MDFTFTSLFSSVLASNVIIIIFCIIFLYGRKTLLIKPKYLLLCLILIMIRCFMPYEFFFTITVPSENMLPVILSIGEYTIPIIEIDLFRLLLYIWIIGIISKFIILCMKQYKIEKTISRIPNSKYMPMLRNIMRENGFTANIDLIEIPGVVSPAIVGLIKPKIVIPDNIHEADLHYILKHELEHYYHHDLYTIAALHVLCILYWWNPVFYILRNNMQKMIEFRVDNIITEKSNEEEKINYLQSILNVAKTNKSIHLKCAMELSLFEKQSDLSQRFENVLCPKYKQNGFILPRLILIICILSTSIILEPYAINKNDEAGTFDIPKNSYFIYKSGKYDLYIGKAYYISVDCVDGFEDIPVYYSEEAMK